MSLELNLLDKVVSYFSPQWGLKRIQRRNAMNILQRGYEGARKDRRTKGWNVNDFEQTAKVAEIKTLKNRSRDLYRNNPYSFRAHNSIANNTTGRGIVPAIKNELLKKIWKDWAHQTSVDFDANCNFYGLQNLCMRTLSMHGSVLILRIKTNNKEHIPLELKVVSTKFLDLSKDSIKTSTGSYISGGIEFASTGKRKGYWIYDKDPELEYSKSTFWKDQDVIHLFFQDEPGQIHGVPFGSPSMMSLRDFDDYADAQLVRQKIASCFSIFITKTDAEMIGADTQDYEEFDRVEPGLIQTLEPGKSVTFASPPPADGYGEYSRNVLTGISAGYGMSYEAMTGDLSHVNYSSGRMGWLEYQRMIETWQNFILIPKLCAKVWLWFVEAGNLLGILPKDTPKTVEWTAPGRMMIDPVKEVNGLLAQVRAGFMSWQEAVRLLGYAPEEILEEMKISKELFDKAGLQPKSDPRYDAVNLKNQSDDTGNNSTQQ